MKAERSELIKLTKTLTINANTLPNSFQQANFRSATTTKSSGAKVSADTNIRNHSIPSIANKTYDGKHGIRKNSSSSNENKSKGNMTNNSSNTTSLKSSNTSSNSSNSSSIKLNHGSNYTKNSTFNGTSLKNETKILNN